MQAEDGTTAHPYLRLVNKKKVQETEELKLKLNSCMDGMMSRLAVCRPWRRCAS